MILDHIKKLHRLIALSSMLFILISTGTGFLLIHYEDFSLDERVLKQPVLLWLYGKPQSFELAGEMVHEDYPPTWGKAITAFHKGRFFGKEWPFFLDFLVFSLLVLVFSGFYLWIKFFF